MTLDPGLRQGRLRGRRPVDPGRPQIGRRRDAVQRALQFPERDAEAKDISRSAGQRIEQRLAVAPLEQQRWALVIRSGSVYAWYGHAAPTSGGHHHHLALQHVDLVRLKHAQRVAPGAHVDPPYGGGRATRRALDAVDRREVKHAARYPPIGDD